MKKLIFTMLFLVFTAVYGYAKEPSLESYRVDSERGGYYVYGTIRNDTGKTCKSICVRFNFYTSFSKTTLIDSVTDCTSGLKDGVTWKFKTHRIWTSHTPTADLESISCH